MSEHFGETSDPLRGRAPTSHERESGEPWDASYRDGPAPWELGEPQPAIVRLASRGVFAGTVLDAGCGSGDNALHLASLGATVIGVDVAATALASARSKARARGLSAEFVALDAFELARLGRSFATVLDCGLFHTFDANERSRYVASVGSVTEAGGTLYVLCFGDDGSDIGPHPVREDELRMSFGPSTGWTIVTIERERILTRFHGERGVSAWLATIVRR